MPKINFNLVGETLIHPMQRNILEIAARDASTVSPKLLSRELGEPLGVVAYHVNMLAGIGKSKFASQPLLELVDTEQRRGALEHFYTLAKEAIQ